ncbi:VOC family protein [Pseudorhodoplanes sinuspersici]|uniref:Glyoxalase n=1 Tax=Pseudorhodoplanes sinuspersici TaxID=1235591 RepID=A0A1W6ZWK3_9HYPH|nr:VOC family protein [Pseudorhodoplanes sinuspersici]ARQ01668.1 glyoxalase [Pseudorhodoplanes sinuspersici]RKE73391.1 glyoxalase-like protein [Pseudorhodoplanes sinuspersici]
MSRGLDHIVHAVRDLDAAADFYRRLGFTIGARNRHPWGTHNHIVQLPGVYIELLTVAEPEKIEPHNGRFFSFGAFHRDVLLHEQGLDMILLDGRNAEADAAAFRTAGIGDFEIFNFEREGKQPDGRIVKLAFSLVYARDPKAPDVGFVTCQHHFPENFWNPAFQQHANGVTDIAGAVMIADNPSDHHIFLSAFTGERDLQSTSTGITVTTPRGDIQVMTPASYTDHFDLAAPDVARGARLGALRLTCPDLSVVEACLSAGRVEAKHHMGRLIVPPSLAHGAAMIFEAATAR